MKKMPETKTRKVHEMASEYRFDYRKARRNRFAGRIAKDRIVVVLDPDISKVFTTPESVNAVLRALITTMPRAKSPRSRKSIGSKEKI